METNTKTQVGSYLTFVLASELYAVHVKNVLNIVELTKITKVPRTPEYMLGIINLRGMVLPVVDARKKFGMPETEITTNTCILVIEVTVLNKNLLVGLMVDGVKEVVEIDASQVKEPPSVGFGNNNRFINGVYNDAAGQFIMILDMEEVFSTEEVVALSNHTENVEQQAE
ncbi:MAG TPA: chemotaxis protein CheW [Bacteroidales bacterium]|nr:chemotaxis protein CheW [Bacteroidales bacterium]